MYKNKFLIAGISIVLAISLLFTYWIKIKQDSFADEIISDASHSFGINLEMFISSVEGSINQLTSKLETVDNNTIENNGIDKLLKELITGNKYLVGVIITNNEFSYILHKDNSSWAKSYDRNISDTLVNWQRLNGDLEVVGGWTDTYNIFPVESSFDEVDKLLSEHSYIWKSSVNKLPGSRDIFTCLFKTNNSDDQEYVTGLIFSTKHLSNYFISVLKFENPLISIITTDRELVTPMLTSDSVVVGKYNLLKVDIENQVNAWVRDSIGTSHSYSFEKFNRIFWTRINTISTKIGVEGFALTMSADDLAETERNQERIYLYAALIFFILSIVVIPSISFRRKKRHLMKGVGEMIPFEDNEIINMISKGETEFVEFKSSVRWDYREGKVNKILENVILKSIAAFANAKGGTLIIGVSDDLEILGLENDFNTLKKKDVDYFELHTRKLIVNQFGIAFSNEHLLFQFPEFEGKIICLIQVRACGEPVFIKTRNKQGSVVEKFYVRSGNSSQEISSLKEINEYIKPRFDTS